MRQPEERDRGWPWAWPVVPATVRTPQHDRNSWTGRTDALGVAAGADPKTFFGLAGVGDLIATCGSSLSRNYTFGANLGKGLTVEEATKVSNGVAEGVPTTDAVVALGDQLDVPTPLAYQMSRVLNEGISCSEMLAGLFGHEVTGE